MIIEDFAAIRRGMDELRSAKGGILPEGPGFRRPT